MVVYTVDVVMGTVPVAEPVELPAALLEGTAAVVEGTALEGTAVEEAAVEEAAPEEAALEEAALEEAALEEAVLEVGGWASVQLPGA